MSWLAVDRNGAEHLYKEKPKANERSGWWFPHDGKIESWTQLAEGTIEKLLGRKLVFADGAIEIKLQIISDLNGVETKACKIPECNNTKSRYEVDGIGYVCSSCMDKIRREFGHLRLPKKQMIEKVKTILIEEPVCVKDLTKDNEPGVEYY